MKSVLRSAKPYWIYLILTGKKTVEVGKDFPKSEDWNEFVEMYCSKDMRSFNRIPEKDKEWMRKYLGKVACRFVCDRLSKIPIDLRTAMGLLTDACLTAKELDGYRGYKDAYSWHISDLKIYDTPRELGKFWKAGKCPYISNDSCTYKYHCFRAGELNRCGERITRPPQSWCYVEEL